MMPNTTPLFGRPKHMAEMQRVCFRLQVRTDLLDEYRACHAAVWPEMLDALGDAGWHNYSLFLDDDGTLIGYFETTSLADARSRMRETDVNDRWQAEMAKFFVGLDGSPDQSFESLPEIFNLESQRATAAAPAPTIRTLE